MLDGDGGDFDGLGGTHVRKRRVNFRAYELVYVLLILWALHHTSAVVGCVFIS